MIEVRLTRGLPGSGKSTYALELLSKDTNWVRVERDLLRDQLFGNRLYEKPDEWNMSDADFKSYLSNRENTISQVQKSMTVAALKAGKSVIVSDTNLRAAYVREWAKLAAAHGAEFTQVIFDNLSIDELLRRDADRTHSVGESVIRMMWQNATKKGKIAEVDVSKEMSDSLVIEPYANSVDLPEAIIVDIDGTLAVMADRSPYEWHRVGEDSPVQAVIDAVKAAHKSGSNIIVMSGRDSSCKYITISWLKKNLGPDMPFRLFMRAEGDKRKDNLVKYELFNDYVRDNYHVSYVLDDRDQVIKMWRALGLAAFQVNYGDF